MIYRAIGLMSGSSLDGLDIAFAGFSENAGKWDYEILKAECIPYEINWKTRLKQAVSLNAEDYQLLHVDYGHWIGQVVNSFIERNHLHYQVALISSHGHTSFHLPAKKMTAQLGDGAAISAETGLPVVTDLRALDVALGGQGAPIVPVGEKMLFGDYDYFLNLGGITNISASAGSYIAFDVCPANRVLNRLANETGKEYDEEGRLAAEGKINTGLLEKLNSLDYYQRSFPKSLANDFGDDVVYPMIKCSGITIKDALRTYVEHIALQIRDAIKTTTNFSETVLKDRLPTPSDAEGLPKAKPNSRLLATGGGAFNLFLIERIKDLLAGLKIDVVVPDEKLINYKEALVMAFIGVLRWRQEYNVLSSVTGASRDSIGGALWNGQEA
jgi:anhydro-N-acetylmuramic acid kinase